MCTVLLRFASGTPRPLLLGAVRDEFVQRAWDPPGAHWGDRLLGGRDRTAGGTWLAVDPDRPAAAADQAKYGVRKPPLGRPQVDEFTPRSRRTQAIGPARARVRTKLW